MRGRFAGRAWYACDVTTVTEAAKRIFGEEDEDVLQSGDLERICADPVLAQRFARRLAASAQKLFPAREWSPEDLRDVLEVAVHGTAQQSARLLEGRYFRKRLREQVNLADRYGDTFAVVVISMVRDVNEGVYASILDAVTERLRRTDLVFLYSRRFALVLPRMRAAGLGPLITRVRELVDVGAGSGAIERISSLVYPDPAYEGAEVLDWAEDQLR